MYSGATELCSDGVDNDCDAIVDNCSCSDLGCSETVKYAGTPSSAVLYGTGQSSSLVTVVVSGSTFTTLSDFVGYWLLT